MEKSFLPVVRRRPPPRLSTEVVPALLLLLLFVPSPQLARSQIIVAPSFSVGVGVGYTYPPIKGSPCPDVLDSYTIVGGSCSGQGCICVSKNSACDEEPGGGIPYAVTCPSTCNLVTPSTDKVNDQCTNDRDEISTVYLECVSSIGFVENTICYIPASTLPPEVTSPPASTVNLSPGPIVSPTPEPTVSPTLNPTPGPSSRPMAAPICGKSTAEYQETMRTFLLDYSDESDLSRPGTPQYASKGWIENNTVCTDNDSVVEMYVLGVMYFGWGIGHLLHGGQGDLCEFTGIECQENVANVRFTKFLLRDRNLEGQISNEIGFLTTLTHLDLSNNHLDGTIPPTLGRLRGLRQLNLAQNFHSGVVPEDIYSLSGLKLLALDRNKLTGTLSRSVGNLVDLQVLSLFSNRFYGLFPNQLGGMRQLKELLLDKNIFQGQCDANLCNSVSYGRLKHFTVDCDEVSCTCATQCHIAYNGGNRQRPVPISSYNEQQQTPSYPVDPSSNINKQDNSWGQPQLINPIIDTLGHPGNIDQFGPNQNQGHGEVSDYNLGGNTQRQTCLCDSLTGGACIQPQLPGCGGSYHWCNFACNGFYPCRCDASNRPCTRNMNRICGSATYACATCSGGSIRGRCVCDHNTGLPCILMRYPVCSQNYYKCNLCR